MAPPSIPKTMKAAIATGFGDIDKNIHTQNDWPTPSLSSFTNDNNKDSNDEGWILIRVLACALAPGDVRVLSGKTKYMQMPSSGHPYIVGSDVSGIVVQIDNHNHNHKFAVGDYVVSRFDEPKPNGGAAEYRLVKASLTEHCPSAIPPTVACGLPASAMAAKRIVTDFMKPHDRVLVLGGSGAVGSSVLQYAKHLGAAFVVAVSTQEKLCLSLGADRVVDYRTEQWWEVSEFCTSQGRFDVVFDLVNGDNWERGACAGTAIQPSGTYVALLTGVQTEIEVDGAWDVMCFGLGMLKRMVWSRMNPYLPTWVAPEALKLEEGDLKELFEDVVQKRLEPLVDPASPFGFTEEGVREAFRLQKSRHAHGKVVIEIGQL